MPDIERGFLIQWSLFSGEFGYAVLLAVSTNSGSQLDGRVGETVDVLLAPQPAAGIE